MSENGFKHIAQPDEKRIMSLGDRVVFYKWIENVAGIYEEHFWGFELFAETAGEEILHNLYVETTFGVVTKPETHQQGRRDFTDIDAATQAINQMVGDKMGVGWRTVRLDNPNPVK